MSPSIWKCVTKRSLFFDNDIFPIVGINVSEDYLLIARLIIASKRTIFLDSQYLYYYELGNEGSYLHNPNLKSVENSADATINSSLKFEIKAKQFYAASQRVL